MRGYDKKIAGLVGISLLGRSVYGVDNLDTAFSFVFLFFLNKTRFNEYLLIAIDF